METVRISKSEYKRLKSKARAYQKLAGSFFESIVKDPVNEVVKDFRETRLYTEFFLKDLESGLRKSSYGKSRK